MEKHTQQFVLSTLPNKRELFKKEAEMDPTVEKVVFGKDATVTVVFHVTEYLRQNIHYFSGFCHALNLMP